VREMVEKVRVRRQEIYSMDGGGSRGGQLTAMAHEKRGEARRIHRVEVGNPVVKLESGQSQEGP
jgi:hypothetical protein